MQQGLLLELLNPVWVTMLEVMTERKDLKIICEMFERIVWVGVSEKLLPIACNLGKP